MRRLRVAVAGGSHGAITRFATELGIGVSRWHNVEHGAPVSYALADMLVKRFPGLTLDWIYYGRRAGMSVDMASLLGELEKPQADTG